MATQAKVEKKQRENATVVVGEYGGAADAPITIQIVGGGLHTFHPGRVADGLRAYAQYHGWKQRLVDGLGGDKTPAERDGIVAALIAHYEGGATDWRVRGVGGGARVGNVMQAFANVYADGNLERAGAMMDKFATGRGIDRKAALAIWKTADRIIAELARMEAARPAAADADALLAEMGD